MPSDARPRHTARRSPPFAGKYGELPAEVSSDVFFRFHIALTRLAAAVAGLDDLKPFASRKRSSSRWPRLSHENEERAVQTYRWYFGSWHYFVLRKRPIYVRWASARVHWTSNESWSNSRTDTRAWNREHRRGHAGRHPEPPDRIHPAKSSPLPSTVREWDLLENPSCRSLDRSLVVSHRHFDHGPKPWWTFVEHRSHGCILFKRSIEYRLPRTQNHLHRTHLEIEWNLQFSWIGGQWCQRARSEDETRKASVDSIERERQSKESNRRSS